MMKRALLGLLVAAAGCGDNSPDLPPEVASANLALSTAEDGTIQIDASAIDPEHRSMTYAISAPLHGTITGVGPHFLYTPAVNFSGHESLVVSVSDGINVVDIVVELTVSAVNDAPVADDLATVTNEGQALAIALVASDIDSPALSYSLDALPAHGTLIGTLPYVTYMPDWQYSGSDSFTFQASDGELASNVATVTISVVNVIACGDGVTEAPEPCDDGNDDNTDGCLTTCQLARCGDGFVQAGVEECDDGNDNDNDACSNTCKQFRCNNVQPGDACYGDTSDACITACLTGR
jgi:cysteine-rich repeat protein